MEKMNERKKEMLRGARERERGLVLPADRLVSDVVFPVGER